MEVTLSRDAAPEDFALDGVTVIACEGRRAELQVSGSVGALIGRLAALPVEDLVFPEASMEDTFTRFYTGEGGDASVRPEPVEGPRTDASVRPEPVEGPGGEA